MNPSGFIDSYNCCFTLHETHHTLHETYFRNEKGNNGK